MTLSMTGYGEAEAKAGKGSVRVEVRSYNSRFLDLKVSLPERLGRFEFDLSRLIRSRIQRGRVEVAVREGRAGLPAVVPKLDLELAKKYAAQLRRLGRLTGIGGKIELEDLLATSADIVRFVEDEQGSKVIWKAIEKATLRALAALYAERKREGRQMERSLLKGRVSIARSVKRIGQLSKRRPDEFRKRLERRISELSGGAGLQVDPQRLAQEVAMLAVKTDINEELSRLGSHLDGFRKTLTAEGPKGKKLDFILQEMSREINTVGAKVQQSEASEAVVSMKCEIEKLREQVANVE